MKCQVAFHIVQQFCKENTAMDKLINLETFLRIKTDFAPGTKIVFTNGCFDILHPGHLTYLNTAKGLGDILVIGLNSDSSVKRIKGPQRPINVQADRAKMLSGLWSVNFVIIFSEDTPRRLIEQIKPDILVKGGDWPIEKIVGHEFVQSYGGKVYSIPLQPGYSTSKLIKKIITRYSVKNH